jgi:hypothetical protein
VLNMPGLPDALPFTSLLNIDLERELGESFDKKRVHVSFCPGRRFSFVASNFARADEMLLCDR